MQKQSIAQRDRWGCGYRPRPADGRVRLTVWRHGGDREKKHPTLCPGYTTTLPEVIEIARARHWKASLETFVRATSGDPRALVPEPLLLGIELLDEAYNNAEAWEWEERERKAKGGA